MRDATAQKMFSYIFFCDSNILEVLASNVPTVGFRFSHGTASGFLMERLPLFSWNGFQFSHGTASAFPMERLTVCPRNGIRFSHRTAYGLLVERLTQTSYYSRHVNTYRNTGPAREHLYTADT